MTTNRASGSRRYPLVFSAARLAVALPVLVLLSGSAPLVARVSAAVDSAAGSAVGAAQTSGITQRLLICGDRLFAVASQVPAGLPSSRCSEARAFGEAMGAPAAGIDPADVAKTLDANSLAMREALLLGSTLGAVYLHVIEEHATGPLEVFRLEITDSLVERISAGADAGGPEESAGLSGNRYTWSVWSPPAPPTTKPTASFCWSVISGAPC
ncbi:MAG: hypothetical protein MI919_36050 [Holophagales bacterium]|nr:hypothetical protein [Holophagales bacterium]